MPGIHANNVLNRFLPALGMHPIPKLHIVPRPLKGRVHQQGKAVTIAAGFRFADGVLLCADTQITYEGIAKVSGTKILPFEFKRSGVKVVFTFSGDVSYAKGG